MEILPLLPPIAIAAAKPLTPEQMWTTVPPAKSTLGRPTSARECMRPPPQTICAIGAYTARDHSAMNTRIAEYLTLSAVAPKTMQAVSRAKVPWKSMYS